MIGFERLREQDRSSLRSLIEDYATAKETAAAARLAWRCEWCGRCAAETSHARMPGPSGPHALCCSCSARFSRGYAGPQKADWTCGQCGCGSHETGMRFAGPDGAGTLCASCGTHDLGVLVRERELEAPPAAGRGTRASERRARARPLVGLTEGPRGVSRREDFAGRGNEVDPLCS